MQSSSFQGITVFVFPHYLINVTIFAKNDLKIEFVFRFFPHYLINVTIFAKNELKIEFVFRFFSQLLPGTFLVLRIHQGDTQVTAVYVRF